LRDILASGIVPATRLLRIFRQSESGRIVSNAHRINHGEYPEFDQRDDSDFLYIPRKTPEEMADAAVRLCSSILSDHYGYDPMRDIQVIAPSRKGPAGIPVLNRTLQAALNPKAGAEKPGLHVRGFRFAEGDRVMQISNDYELEWCDSQKPPNTGIGIFNGETGVILAVDEDDGTIEVLFDEDRRVVYDRSLLDELEPAYAVTVHKSQGSEYPVVVLVLPPGPPMLLTRNLLYTAVTRAKERLFLISSGDILSRVVANARRNERYTSLEGYLKNARASCEQSLPIFGA
jgi:exodeoxyribonuclease V alpha subunit